MFIENNPCISGPVQSTPMLFKVNFILLFSSSPSSVSPVIWRGVEVVRMHEEGERRRSLRPEA